MTKQKLSTLFLVFMLASSEAYGFQTRPQTLQRLQTARTFMSLDSKEYTTPVVPAAPTEDDGLSFAAKEDSLAIIEDTSEQQQPMILDEEQEQYKYIMLGLLWTVAVLSALDRVAMSVALVPMSQEFDFSGTVKGSISSFFSVGYGLVILPAGLIIATASPRIIMAIGLTCWSLGTIATPPTTGLATIMPLLLVRSCVGAAESVVIPTIQRLLAAWTTAEEKSVALATIFSGFHTGTILAYLASPVVMDYAGGWRGLFYVYGAIGLATLVPWLALAKDSPVLAAEKADATSTATPTFQDKLQGFKEAPWKDFVQSSGVWAICLAHCAKNWGLYNSLAWTPTFYAEQYDIGVRDSALLSVLPSVAGAVGGFVAGSIADSIIRGMDNASEEQLTKIRKIFQGFGLLGPAVALGTLAWHIPEQPWVAQCFLMAAVGLQAFNAAGFEAATQEKAGEKWAGLLYSVTSLPAVMIGTTGVYITGQLLDMTNQDWSYVFGLNAFINVLGASAFLLLYNSKKEFD